MSKSPVLRLLFWTLYWKKDSIPLRIQTEIYTKLMFSALFSLAGRYKYSVLHLSSPQHSRDWGRRTAMWHKPGLQSDFQLSLCHQVRPCLKNPKSHSTEYFSIFTQKPYFIPQWILTFYSFFWIFKLYYCLYTAISPKLKTWNMSSSCDLCFESAHWAMDDLVTL